jgi:hypothetical protein
VFALKNCLKELETLKRRTPIEAMIDAATGFDSAKITDLAKLSLRHARAIQRYHQGAVDNGMLSEQIHLDKIKECVKGLSAFVKANTTPKPKVKRDPKGKQTNIFNNKSPCGLNKDIVTKN